jgi:predicted enzyme related to lactoylglutathione lyase
MTVWRLPGYVGGEPQQPVPRDVVAVLAPAGDGVPPHWNVNFWVADADATAGQAVRAGGRVLMGPVDTPGFRSAVLVDPHGAAFSISQLVAA